MPRAAERLAALRLARTESVGPVTFRELVRRFGSARDTLDALPDIARNAGRAAPLRITPADEAERELACGARLGAQLLILGDEDYPALLAATEDAPPLLWLRGRMDLLAGTPVAVVGARIASASGQRFARGLASGLGAAGVTVVSGMARGIDSAAHEGALSTGTVAVLAGGVDDVYPAENRGLYERLCAEGSVVSERPPGLKAKAQDFVRRNRIISGLSLAVVVVEAEMRSGSLTTARLAGEQGREVYAVPGSPLDPRAKGTNSLIKSGAMLCEGAEDVIAGLRGLSHLREDDGRYQPAAADDAEVDALRDALADLLSPTPVSRDELVRATGGSTAAVFAALSELALAGRAELMPGGMVARI